MKSQAAKERHQQQAPGPETFEPATPGLEKGNDELVLDQSIHEEENAALIVEDPNEDNFGAPPPKRNGCISIICCICCCDTSGFGSKNSLEHLSDKDMIAYRQHL